ncbi:hypothetical protein HID58_070082 [Brassica napus]|uniref:RING-type domain-containing protein n=1 Tax=Brassica napus TaxID=3708 RepID=A0ABQ7YXR3_BRANA|nr:hypothetical protein HID58_070082 [Brassica napus]
MKDSRRQKMLAIFQKTFAHPPEELNSPASNLSGKTPKLPGETLSDFLSNHPDSAFSMSFGDSAVLAFARPENSHRPRMFSGIDGIYCVFLGALNNLCDLNKQYGLSGKSSNEAMFVIEAYRTLRDRGPYPADQVLRGLDGSFAFVVYDAQTSSVFAALGSDGAESLYWGIAADGSVVMSDDLKVIKQGCAKSFAPFPTGCMFHSESGLMSYEHPKNKMKAMQRIDSEGVICGANFKVDACSKINSIPRRGSEANWSLASSITMVPPPFPSLEIYIYQLVESMIDPQKSVYHFIKRRKIPEDGFLRCCCRAIALDLASVMASDRKTEKDVSADSLSCVLCSNGIEGENQKAEPENKGSRDAIEIKSKGHESANSYLTEEERVMKEQTPASCLSSELVCESRNVVFCDHLLALSERIGTVNTGLTEEDVKSHLKRRTCSKNHPRLRKLKIKLNLAPYENFKNEKKIATLDCGHEYHAECLEKWLIVKNLCPICKSEALAMEKRNVE